MDENVNKNTRTPDTKTADTKTNEQFEQKKRDALEVFLAESVNFVKLDNRINLLLEELLGSVVEEVKRDPGSVLSGKGDNMDFSALIQALKAKSEGGISGGDIVGGAVSLGDIADFIGKLGGLIESEKKFFLKIIFLIFCNCDCVCKCLCD